MINYEKKLAKIKEAALRKESRLKKRLDLAKNKPKKTPVRLLKKKLWKITSKIVRQGVVRCYTCPKPLTFKGAHAGHFFTKGGHPATAFDLENLRPQCPGCNLFKSGNLAIYATKLLAEYGKDKFMLLAFRANQVKKWDRAELEQLIEEREVIFNLL